MAFSCAFKQVGHGWQCAAQPVASGLINGRRKAASDVGDVVSNGGT
jgi:hypothetical protein